MAHAAKALIIFCLGLSLLACDSGTAPVPSSPEADTDGHGPATASTVAANKMLGEALSGWTGFDNSRDAERGLVASAEQLQVPGFDDTLAWDGASYDFISGKAPDTVNPSLWRQEGLLSLIHI